MWGTGGDPGAANTRDDRDDLDEAVEPTSPLGLRTAEQPDVDNAVATAATAKAGGAHRAGKGPGGKVATARGAVSAAPPGKKRPGTTLASASAAPKSATAAPTSAPATGPKVNVNSAGEAELDTLPGIGPVKARAIIDHRAAHGPFKTIDSLIDVYGIGPATLEKLRPLVEL